MEEETNTNEEENTKQEEKDSARRVDVFEGKCVACDQKTEFELVLPLNWTHTGIEIKVICPVHRNETYALSPKKDWAKKLNIRKRRGAVKFYEKNPNAIQPLRTEFIELNMAPLSKEEVRKLAREMGILKKKKDKKGKKKQPEPESTATKDKAELDSEEEASDPSTLNQLVSDLQKVRLIAGGDEKSEQQDKTSELGFVGEAPEELIDFGLAQMEQDMKDSSLKKHKKAKLVELCEERNLNSEGTRPELIARLQGYRQANEDSMGRVQ